MRKIDQIVVKMLEDLDSIKISAILVAEATKMNPGYQEILNITEASISKLNVQVTKRAISIQMEK